MREFDLLVHLVRHPGRAFSRNDLMLQVWGWEFGDLSTVTVHVRRLRAKVEADPARPVRLVTVWGVGYRWDAAAGELGRSPDDGTARSGAVDSGPTGGWSR
jgi:DNA-binding response OmpR family regulator